jgi:DivIVA domain-containing protein
MATALVYLMVLLVVAALFFVIASAVFGRGEELAPIPPGSSPTWLPDGEVGPGDVRALRFQQAVRGYRMAEVDWVLDRLAAELERVTDDRDDLRHRLADLEDGPAGAPEDAEKSTEQPSEEPERA